MIDIGTRAARVDDTRYPIIRYLPDRIIVSPVRRDIIGARRDGRRRRKIVPRPGPENSALVYGNFVRTEGTIGIRRTRRTRIKTFVGPVMRERVFHDYRLFLLNRRRRDTSEMAGTTDFI